MRRADRLFQLLQFLRRHRHAVTAKVIAEHFGLSERTIYRDVQSLMASGVPVHGEAGVGYLFDRRYELPPVMFDADELEALVLGAAMVSNWTDNAFAEKAKGALEKITAVLPEALQAQMDQLVLFSQPSDARPPWQISFSELRECIRQLHIIEFSYTDEKGQLTRRSVRPLAMAFFGPVWLLLGWCELRNDFRSFRLDRISKLVVTEEKFVPEKGQTLQDYRMCYQ